MKYTFLILLFISLNSFCQINKAREFELDSIVSNIDKVTLINLDSLHKYIHYKGTNSEERVFMFYGIFSIHYKYDFKRQGEKGAKVYTNHYTAYKRKAVCRDFASLFKELCDRSKIPCVVLTGKVKISFLQRIITLSKFEIINTRHAWNTVKYNRKWHIMDPTWTKIIHVEKHFEEDKQGNNSLISKVKIPSREHYNSDIIELNDNRKVDHPAFCIKKIIYKHNSVFKKLSRKKIIDTNYNYEKVLDSLYLNSKYKYSSDFKNEATNYSKEISRSYTLFLYWNFLEHKRSKYDKLTVKECLRHLKEFEEILNYIKEKNGHDYSSKFFKHKLEVYKTIRKLKNNDKTP